MPLKRLLCCIRPTFEGTQVTSDKAKAAQEVCFVADKKATGDGGHTAFSPGGRTLLVTAQSGSAQEFLRHLEVPSGAFTPASSPVLGPLPSQRSPEGQVVLQRPVKNVKAGPDHHPEDTFTSSTKRILAAASNRASPQASQSASPISSTKDSNLAATSSQHSAGLEDMSVLKVKAQVGRSDSCPAGDLQRPPKSLLEASSRRRELARSRAARGPLAAGNTAPASCGMSSEGTSSQPAVRSATLAAEQLEQQMESSQSKQGALQRDQQQLTTIQNFMSAYVANLEGSRSDLANDMTPLLTETVMLLTHDGKTYAGSSAVLHRLQRGIKMLQTMAGNDTAAAKSLLENFRMEAPVKAGDDVWTVKYRLKRGIFRLNITNTFCMQQQLISSLKVTRS